MSGLLAFCAGTAAFVIGFVLLLVSDFWRDGSNTWWLWVAGASAVGGLLGIWVFARRRLHELHPGRPTDTPRRV